jgi:DNA-binding MarR family transcriptional regulator
VSEHGHLDAKLVAALERVGQALRVQLRDAAKQHGLNPIQLQVLLRLAAAPPLGRVGALAAAFDVSQPSMSDTVAALRRKGLVGAGPRRRSGIVLTPRGQALARALNGWDDRTRQALGAAREADKERSLALLLDVIAGLQRTGAVSVARMCTTCRFFRPEAHPGQARRHHCALLDAPLTDGDLRVDCPEHEAKAA